LQERRRRHFTKILNIHSEFDVEELGRVRQRLLRSALADLPKSVGCSGEDEE
jgi:hypothetical protein